MFRISLATAVAAAVIGLGPAAQAYTFMNGMSLSGWTMQQQSKFDPQYLDGVAAVDPGATFQLIAQRRVSGQSARWRAHKVGAVQTRMSVAISNNRKRR